MPPGIAHLLGLIRILVSFGQDLAASLRRDGLAPRLHPINPFGITDIGQILARITRGLLRAAALQDMLLQRAATGRDVTPPPPPPVQPGPQGHTGNQSSQDRQGSRNSSHHQQVGRAPGPNVLYLPTPQELAEEVRSQPIGVTLLAICEDLGIIPSLLDPIDWRALFVAIATHGGQFAPWLQRMTDRCMAFWTWFRPTPAPPPTPPPPLTPATGPP